MNIDKITLSGATVIDVRNDWEFEEGHVPGSVNIPLFEIPTRLEELRTYQTPLVFCCASGNRSSQATAFLKQHGFPDVYNGGSWVSVAGLKNS